MKKVNIPEGVSGHWKVEKFTISDNEARMAVFSYGGRAPSAGTYTKITHGGTVVMSDTNSEMMDHYSAVRNATG